MKKLVCTFNVLMGATYRGLGSLSRKAGRKNILNFSKPVLCGNSYQWLDISVGLRQQKATQ